MPRSSSREIGTCCGDLSTACVNGLQAGVECSHWSMQDKYPMPAVRAHRPIYVYCSHLRLRFYVQISTVSLGMDAL